MTGRGRSLVALEVAAAVILVPLLVASVYLARLDPSVVKARVAQEVQRATGRDLHIGAMHLTLVPDLTIDADDVALANPPGFSRAEMVAARHVHAKVALLPLLAHHVVIREMALTSPDLKLEQAADGTANWHFAPRPAAVVVGDAAPAAPAGRMRLDSLTVLDVSVVGGALSWSLPGASGALTLPKAKLREVNASSTMHFTADANIAGEAVALAGRLGGQTHLWNAADRTDWPIELSVRSDAGTVSVTGSMTQPRALAGYDLTVQARGPDLGRLTAPFPALAVPRLRDLVLDARVVDRQDGIDIPRLNFAAGSSDLSATVPGLTLDRLAIAAPNIDGGNGTLTNRVTASGRYDGQALAVDATLGSVGRLFGRGQISARAPIRLDATARVAGASLSVQGRVAPTGDWAGTDVAIQATIPDLAALSPLAGRPLPKLLDVDFSGAVHSVRGELVLHDVHLTNELIDLRVDGNARLGGRPRYLGRVTVARMDLDALRAMPMGARAPARAAREPSDAAPPTAARTLIPDREIDLGWLHGRDVDLGLSVARLTSHAVNLDDLTARVRLEAGRLNIDPLAVSLAGAPISGSLSMDAARTPSALAVEARGTGIDAGALLALLGVSPDAAGRLDADVSLAGSGATPHALASTLSGHVGIALTDGQLDNRVLSSVLAALVPATKFGLSLPRTGRSAIACLATRIDLREGVGVPRAFALDLDRLRLTAAGAIDFGAETVALRLRPDLRLGRTELVLPSRVDGPWLQPNLSLEPARGAASAASFAVGLIGPRGRSAAALLTGVAGAADGLLTEPDSGDCAHALAVARDVSRPAASPVAAAGAPSGPASPRQRAVELLKRLFGRAR